MIFNMQIASGGSVTKHTVSFQGEPCTTGIWSGNVFTDTNQTEFAEGEEVWFRTLDMNDVAQNPVVQIRRVGTWYAQFGDYAIFGFTMPDSDVTVVCFNDE